MQQLSGLKKSLLRLGTQGVVFLVVAVLMFAPFNQVFQTPQVQAATGCPVGTFSSTSRFYTGLFGGTGYKEACFNSEDIYGEVVGYVQQDGSYKRVDTLAEEQKKIAAAGGSWLDPVWDFLTQIVYNFTVAVGGFFASVGASFFNFSVHISLSSTAYGLQFVTDGWGTARDLANMFFILILIYLAVTITLAADTGKTMHTLVRVLFIALIINFSFFITRVVIDAGNFTATQFYNQIEAGSTSPIPGVGAVVVTKDLTKGIMAAVGAEELLGTNSFEKFKKQIGGGGEFITILVISLFMGATYAVLAAVFVATGIKFIMRVAVLWLTIIASPLALVASTVPQFEGWFKKWRDALISHAFFPVVFLFIFWQNNW